MTSVLNFKQIIIKYFCFKHYGNNSNWKHLHSWHFIFTWTIFWQTAATTIQKCYYQWDPQWHL